VFQKSFGASVDLPAKRGFSFAAHFSGGSSNSNCRACKPASGALHAVAMDRKSSFFLAPNRAYDHPDIGVGAGFKKFLMG